MAEATENNEPKFEISTDKQGGVQKAVMRLPLAPNEEMVFTYYPSVETGIKSDTVSYNCKVEKITRSGFLKILSAKEPLLKYQRRLVKTLPGKAKSGDKVLDYTQLLDRPFNPDDPEAFEDYFCKQPDGTYCAGHDSLFVDYPKKGANRLDGRLIELEMAVRETISNKIQEVQAGANVHSILAIGTLIRIREVKDKLAAYRGEDLKVPTHELQHFQKSIDMSKVDRTAFEELIKTKHRVRLKLPNSKEFEDSPNPESAAREKRKLQREEASKKRKASYAAWKKHQGIEPKE